MSRLFDSKKSSTSIAPRLGGAPPQAQKDFNYGPQERPSRPPERPSASADTPPLLIQTTLSKNYQQRMIRPQKLQNNLDESDLDPTDFDENVIASPQNSLTGKATGLQLHNSQQQLATQTQSSAANNNTKSSVISWKNLAKMFFRSPDPRPDTQKLSGSQRLPEKPRQSLHQKKVKQTFARSMISPGFASSSETPAFRGHPPNEQAKGTLQHR